MSLFKLAALSALLLSTGQALAHGPEEHGSNHSAVYGEPGDPTAQARVIEVAMREGDGKMLFSPAVVTVTKGEQIRFQLKNEGELEHEFVFGTAEEIEVHAEMMKAMPDMKHDDPNAKRLEPKASGDIVWKFTTSGEFDFACLIPGHKEAGMKGKIIVK